MTAASVNQLLEHLGLTEYESKTLSTLFSLSEAEAPEVSRLAQVPKTRVYDVLDKLVKKSLVIEIRGRPKKYRVVDAQKALDQLVERKKTELNELEQRVEGIKSDIQQGGSGKSKTGETVMKVKDRHDFEKILGQEIESAQESIQGFTEITDKHHALREAVEKAQERNVNVQLLNYYDPATLKKPLKNVDMKHNEHGLNALVIDNKKVIMALSDFKKDNPEYHFTIWHDNRPVANALGHYFTKCWGG
jgi:HTH-type transcriptional regulator, sugar sensing transcriptional regulator